MASVRWLARLAGVVIVATLAAASTFLAMFVYGNSPRSLAWVTALAATVTAATGMLFDWERKRALRRAADALALAALADRLPSHHSLSTTIWTMSNDCGAH